MPGDVSRNLPAADLDAGEQEEFEIWRRSRSAIAQCVARVEGQPKDEHYILADDVLLALMSADLVIVKRSETDLPPSLPIHLQGRTLPEQLRYLAGKLADSAVSPSSAALTLQVIAAVHSRERQDG